MIVRMQGRSPRLVRLTTRIFDARSSAWSVLRMSLHQTPSHLEYRLETFPNIMVRRKRLSDDLVDTQSIEHSPELCTDRPCTVS